MSLPRWQLVHLFFVLLLLEMRRGRQHVALVLVQVLQRPFYAGRGGLALRLRLLLLVLLLLLVVVRACPSWWWQDDGAERSGCSRCSCCCCVMSHCCRRCSLGPPPPTVHSLTASSAQPAACRADHVAEHRHGKPTLTRPCFVRYVLQGLVCEECNMYTKRRVCQKRQLNGGDAGVLG
jgi:hypothetical protein